MISPLLQSATGLKSKYPTMSNLNEKVLGDAASEVGRSTPPAGETPSVRLQPIAPAHTPGPWEWKAVKGGWDGVEDSSGAVICRLSLNVPANAILIAAAPDLLSALQDLLKECPAAHHTSPLFAARMNAFAAIAKATGK